MTRKILSSPVGNFSRRLSRWIDLGFISWTKLNRVLCPGCHSARYKRPNHHTTKSSSDKSSTWKSWCHLRSSQLRTKLKIGAKANWRMNLKNMVEKRGLRYVDILDLHALHAELLQPKIDFLKIYIMARNKFWLINSKSQELDLNGCHLYNSVVEKCKR